MAIGSSRGVSRLGGAKALLLLGILVIGQAGEALGATPAGVVKIGKRNIFQQGPVTCGLVNDAWVPGKDLGRGKFLSLAAEREDLVARFAGATTPRKQRITRQIAKLDSLIAKGAPACDALPSQRGKNALRFSLSGKAGLALSNGDVSRNAKATPARSNLLAVSSDGSLAPAVSSGFANVRQFVVAPNDKLYVVFSSRVNLEDTTQSGNCLLAEVDTGSGIPSCVDWSLADIRRVELAWNLLNAPIQLDSAGAIYYAGYTSEGSTVLRKYLNGSMSDLINDNVIMSDFLVLPDGTVLVNGMTLSTGGSWVRRISPSGGVKNLIVNRIGGTYLTALPDGKVAVGSQKDEDGSWGTFTYNPAIDDIDAARYFGSASIAQSLGEPPPAHNTDTICRGTTANVGICPYAGALIRSAHTTLSGEVYVVAGVSNRVLSRFFSSIAFPETSLKTITVSRGFLNNIVLSGLNANRRNITTMFDTRDGSEVQLIGVDKEIEVYHLNMLAAENKILFDGLRFADGKYVLGQIDLTTMTVTSTPTGTGKLVDFQTF